MACLPPRTRSSTRLQTGVRGETYAYWYLRRLGYLFIAKNYSPSHSKGEIDLIGYDGNTLVFVEVRTRAPEKGKTALPELSITREKHHLLVRTTHYFLRDRHIGDCPLRFDVVAIDKPSRSPSRCSPPQSCSQPEGLTRLTTCGFAHSGGFF